MGVAHRELDGGAGELDGHAGDVLTVNWTEALASAMAMLAMCSP